jgi:nitrite reductase (NADH) small subunit
VSDSPSSPEERPPHLVELPELDERGRALFVHDGRPYAAFTVGEEVVVIDGSCPHRGGPIGEGVVRDGVVVCPWHWYAFDLRSGRCTTAAQAPLRRHPVERAADGRRVALLSTPVRPSWSALLRAHARDGAPPGP